jgi:hypothetical protein
MVALAADHRSMHLRRWMISAGIVVLAHAGIVSAVLTWRTLRGGLETQAPIEIRLTPETATPPVTTAPPVAPARPASPARPATKTPPEAPPTTRREEVTESPPGEQLPRATSPVIVTPEDRAQREHDALYANQGPAGGGQANPLSGPIDTTLANPSLRPNIGGKSNDWRKALLTHRRPVGSSAQSWPRGPRVANGAEARNAIGVLEPRTSPSNAAISPLRIPGQSASGAGAIGHATNALGIQVENPNRPPRNIAPFAPAASVGGISGTGLGRPGSGAATVGGAAQSGTTGLNGSSFRPR